MSLCIWNAGCVFFTLALCARTAAWSPSSTRAPPNPTPACVSLPPHPPLVLPHPQPLAPAALFASWELTEPLAYLTVKVKVYAESHQRATRKGFQLVITPARAPPKSEKEKQQRLARIQGVASHAILPAPSPPEASRSTSNPPIRSPIVTVVV